MSSPDTIPPLLPLQNAISTIEALLCPVIADPPSTHAHPDMPLVERAHMYATLAYAVNTLVFGPQPNHTPRHARARARQGLLPAHQERTGIRQGVIADRQGRCVQIHPCWPQQTGSTTAERTFAKADQLLRDLLDDDDDDDATSAPTLSSMNVNRIGNSDDNTHKKKRKAAADGAEQGGSGDVLVASTTTSLDDRTSTTDQVTKLKKNKRSKSKSIPSGVSLN
ncbi:hypothetical protein SeMB42_g07510 [Synchytrium endobioticum]|uniref:Exosome complex protein n=1 Tax=Synchytrium endobioticum TaxID=286115 RepID=A0A507C6H9_9FUNG|nr:hypothetical protein SeMB42_g07510 [Synchytrium endobioticum]TPX42799.1 hypothetical protein SeLEV6574_g05403 [Synchytrium endobioticum]